MDDDTTVLQEERHRPVRGAVAGPRDVGSHAAVVEVELRISSDRRIVRPSRKLGKKNGWDLWRVELPANKRATLAYTVEPVPETTAN